MGAGALIFLEQRDGRVHPGAAQLFTAAGKLVGQDGTIDAVVIGKDIDTPVELEYYRNGGILQTVIRKKLNEARQPAMA